MRQIKFKFWDKERKEFYCYKSGSYYFNNKKIIEVGYLLNNENFETLQFTGLKDKNGKEIYDSDILKSGNKVYKVENNYKFLFWLEIYINEFNFEVIGNSIENPELLNT